LAEAAAFVLNIIVALLLKEVFVVVACGHKYNNSKRWKWWNFL